MKVQIELTAAQERQLIQIGLAALAHEALGQIVIQNKKKQPKELSPAQRRKFAATMTKQWTAKKKQAAQHVNGHAPTMAAKAERRATTAVVLSKFDAKQARTIDQAGVNGQLIGSLVRYGYLRERDGGFIRTAKAFDA